MTKVRSLLVLGAMLAAALVIAACGSDSSSSDSGGTIIRGTTDQPISYDPAGAYDLPSYDGIYSMYQNLLTVEPGGRQGGSGGGGKLRLHRQGQQGLRVHAEERPEVLRRLRPDRRRRRLLVRAQHQDRRPERRLLAAREHEEHRGEGRRHRRLQPQGVGRDLAAAPHHRLVRDRPLRRLSRQQAAAERPGGRLRPLHARRLPARPADGDGEERLLPGSRPGQERPGDHPVLRQGVGAEARGPEAATSTSPTGA